MSRYFKSAHVSLCRPFDVLNAETTHLASWPPSVFRGVIVANACIAIAICCSCSGVSTAYNAATDVAAKVSVAPKISSIAIGQTEQFTASAEDRNGDVLDGITFKWSSDAPTIATVSGNGLTSAVSSGTAHITATSPNGISSSATFTVQPPPVSTVTVSPATAQINVGQNQQFSAVAEDREGNSIGGVSFDWSCDAPTVASVNNRGLTTALNPGTAHINASAPNGISGSAVLMVQPAAVASVTVSPVSAQINVGQEQQFTAVAKDANGNIINGISFTWSSGDPPVASINGSGLASALSAGAARVSATALNASSGSATLVVLQPPAITVSISPSSVTIPSGGQQQFSASVTGSSNVAVTWSTSGGGITAEGLFSAPSVSDISVLSITATSTADEAASASAIVTVDPTESAAVIPSSFFGMHLAVADTSLTNPPPWGTAILAPITVGAMGKCVVSYWSYVEETLSVYDWNRMDTCTEWAAHFGIKYFQSSFYMTPASIGATDPSSDSRCWPAALPGVYYCQGTMTPAGEQQWISFNAAMALRYKGNVGMDFYEGWNEPPYAGNSTASPITAAQLAQYEQDRVTAIRVNDPDAKVASPAFVIDISYPSYATFMDDFFSNNPPAYDYYDFHINYPSAPEDEIPMIAQFKQILATHGIVSPTIYATEAGRGGSGGDASLDTCPTWPSTVGPDLQQAFIARMELLYWAQGISRHYWYAYDVCGTLTNQPTSSSLNPAGIAYGNVESWMVGNSMTQPCLGPAYPDRGVWTCVLTQADGKRALAVWDSSQSCAEEACTTSSYAYDPSYKRYSSLDGSLQPLTGETVQIGAKPILLFQ